MAVVSRSTMVASADDAEAMESRCQFGEKFRVPQIEGSEYQMSRSLSTKSQLQGSWIQYQENWRGIKLGKQRIKGRVARTKREFKVEDKRRFWSLVVRCPIESI